MWPPRRSDGLVCTKPWTALSCIAANKVPATQSFAAAGDVSMFPERAVGAGEVSACPLQGVEFRQDYP
eukprot:419367-Rhodomonas_salina.2